MTMKPLYTLLCLMAIPFLSSAQDTIEQKNGDVLKVKIVELADDYVKFYHFEDPDQVEIVMNRSLIREIDFEYGRTEKEVDPGQNESYFVDDKQNNILVNFTSIATRTGLIGYEHSLNPNSSIGGGVKIHGLGAQTGFYDNKSGFGIEANYKVKTGTIFKKGDYRPNHLLQGFYLRPDIGFTSVDFDNDSGSLSSENYSYLYGGFDFGNQWVFNNTLTLDIYTGINFYGGTNEITNGSGEVFENQFLDIRDGNIAGAEGVGARYGLQLGFLFN